VNWIQFTRDRRLQSGYDPRRSLASHPRGKAVTRRHYRYQVQGPNAAKVLEKLNGDRFPTSNSSPWMPSISRVARSAPCVNGMAGAPGLEIWGPYAEGDEIRDAILEAGREFDLVPVVRAPTPAIRWNRMDSFTLPAVYTGER